MLIVFRFSGFAPLVFIGEFNGGGHSHYKGEGAAGGKLQRSVYDSVNILVITSALVVLCH